ncbi:MAG: hypothetical protein AB1801_11990, partial [Chloroflexota bacterium]
NGCFLAKVKKTAAYQWQIEANYEVQGTEWGTVSYTDQFNFSLEDNNPGDGFGPGAALQLSYDGTLPDPEINTFAVGQTWTRCLGDGITLKIPANAVNTQEQQAQISIKPTAKIPNTYLYRPLNYGYEIVLYEAGSGKQITKNLNRNMLIAFHYTDAQLTGPAAEGLAAAGVSASSLQPGYLSGDTWRPIESFTLDPVNKTVTVQTNHMGTFALLVPGGATQQQAGGSVYLPIVIK